MKFIWLFKAFRRGKSEKDIFFLVTMENTAQFGVGRN